MLADRWNRHQQLIISTVFWGAQLGVLYTSDGYNGLIVAELMAALAWALRSGTVEAYLHEAIMMKDNNRKSIQWQGRLAAGSLVMQTLASLLGGWLFERWVEGPVLTSLVFAILGIWLSLGLPDISQVRGDYHLNPFKDVYRILHWSFREHARLPWLLWGPPVLIGSTTIVFWAVQARLILLGISPVWQGVALCSTLLLQAGMAFCMDRLLACYGQRALIVALPLMLAVGIMFVALSPFALLVWLGGIIGSGAVQAIGRPFNISLINNEVRDSDRVAVLSVGNLVNTLTGAVLLLASQPLLDFFSISQVLISYLIVTLLLAGYPLYQLLKPTISGPLLPAVSY